MVIDNLAMQKDSVKEYTPNIILETSITFQALNVLHSRNNTGPLEYSVSYFPDSILWQRDEKTRFWMVMKYVENLRTGKRCASDSWSFEAPPAFSFTLIY